MKPGGDTWDRKGEGKRWTGKERWSNSQEGDRPTDRGKKGHRDTTREKQRGRKMQTDHPKKGMGKTDGPREKNEDRQQERLEEKAAVRAKVSLGWTTSVWGGEGRRAQDVIQSRSWVCTPEAQGQWSAGRSQGWGPKARKSDWVG